MSVNLTCDLFAHNVRVFVYRPEKMAKLPVILGNLDVSVDSVPPDVISKVSFDRFLFLDFSI